MLSIVKTISKILTRIFALLLVFLFISVTAEAADIFTMTTGVVNTRRLNIRQTPSRHAPVLKVIKKGDIINISDHVGGVGGWLGISFRGIRGYIRNRPRYVMVTMKNASKKNPTIVKMNTKDIKKAELIHKKIFIQTKKNENFTKKELEIIDGLNDIGQSLSRMRKMVLSTSDDADKLGVEIANISAQREKLLSEISKNKIYAKARLRALYKMKMMGKTEVFSMPESVFDFILDQDYLKRIISSDMKTLDKDMAEVKALVLITKQLVSKKEKKRLLDDRLNDQIRVMKKESQRRRAILKEIRRKKRLGLAAVASLKEASKRLDSKMQAIMEPPMLKKRGISFAGSMGKLQMPVKGEIISRFGPERNSDYTSFTFQSGIDIKVDRGEPVRSVFKGKIIFAKWLNGYGNMIIINHGDSYYTLYAHVDEIFKKKGSVVDTGEVIATAGDTGSMRGPCLHFEVRHHGQPVNPVKWLKPKKRL